MRQLQNGTVLVLATALLLPGCGPREMAPGAPPKPGPTDPGDGGTAAPPIGAAVMSIAADANDDIDRQGSELLATIVRTVRVYGIESGREPPVQVRVRNGVLERTDGTAVPVWTVFAGNDGVGATQFRIASIGPHGAAGDLEYGVEVLLNMTWQGLCADGGRALPAPFYTRSGDDLTIKSELQFSCQTGVVAKCLDWGYKPWHPQLSDLPEIDGWRIHQACVHMARADYRASNVAHTFGGTFINHYDRMTTPNGAPAPIGHETDKPPFLTEAAWSVRGATCVSRQRWNVLPLTGSPQLPTCESLGEPPVLRAALHTGGPLVFSKSVRMDAELRTWHRADGLRHVTTTDPRAPSPDGSAPQGEYHQSSVEGLIFTGDSLKGSLYADALRDHTIELSACSQGLVRYTTTSLPAGFTCTALGRVFRRELNDGDLPPSLKELSKKKATLYSGRHPQRGDYYTTSDLANLTAGGYLDSQVVEGYVLKP